MYLSEGCCSPLALRGLLNHLLIFPADFVVEFTRTSVFASESGTLDSSCFVTFSISTECWAFNNLCIRCLSDFILCVCL